MFRILITLGLFLCTCSYHVPMTFSRETILKPFQEGKAFKVISGINNFNQISVEKVAKAADIGGASHVDIACDPELVQAAKRVCSLPICVSSIVPIQFVRAVQAGADMIELGNYDGFYEQGIKFSAETILALTKETRQLFPRIPLSVTIPHTLTIAEQITLAQQLVQTYQVDILQTEGKVSSVGPTKPLAERTVTELMTECAPTFASTIALSQTLPHTPILCSSGMNELTASIALSLGARGVGVGRRINALQHVEEMVCAVITLAQRLGRPVRTDHPLYEYYVQQQQREKQHIPVLSL